MLKQKISTFAVVFLSLYLVTACTGGLTGNTVSSEQGGFKITPGAPIELDMSDLADLGLADDLTITLKSVSPDYKVNVIYDLTDFIVKNPSPDNHYKLILPKDIAGIRPMLFSVEAPSLKAVFNDVFYADTVSAKPGIASSLAYELIKYYPNKNLSNWTSAQFTGIKGTILQKVAQIQSETEQLSLSSVRFDRVMKFYKNSMAFNPTFLDSLNPFGVQYTYSLKHLDGIIPADTPEASTATYVYAGDFKVNGVTPLNNPFNQSNNPARLVSAAPGLGNNISANEGTKLTLSATATDPDDDFVDRSYIINYTPRILPKNLPAGIDPAHLPKPEPVSSFLVKTNLGKPADPAVFESDLIGFNEGLNEELYKKGLLGTTPCTATDTDVDCGATANRDIYLIITDGMVRVPYHWNFKYVDINRTPKIIAAADGKINDTTLDDKKVSEIPGATFTADYGRLAAVDGAAAPGVFRQHASHCETNSQILEQTVRARADGPWSCVFRSYDPDLDDDPNAATDDYYYTVANYESSTEILTNGVKISPFSPAKQVTGARLESCIDNNGVTHRQCGLALYAITVDNSVKVAAAQKASSEFIYDLVLSDRVENGMQATKTLARTIRFTPIPPRFVNFDQRSKPAILPNIGSTYTAADQASDPAKVENTYVRNDIYIDEVIANAKVKNAADAKYIGFREDFFGSINRPSFHFTSNGTAADISSYVTQPHRVQSNTPTIDPATGNLTAASTPVPKKLGHLMYNPSNVYVFSTDYRKRQFFIKTPIAGITYDPNDFNTYTRVNAFDDNAQKDTWDSTTYSYPREYDRACNLGLNNSLLDPNANAIVDQREFVSPLDENTVLASGGWTFELNAVDLDNLDLRVSEPYEPVYFNISSNDANSFGNTGLIQYCIPKAPNPDVQTYQTYGIGTSVTGVVSPAVQEDACDWSSTAPQTMQPKFIYYEKQNDDGSTEFRKMVYHRVRMKWQPIDHPEQDGTYLANLIKNHLINFTIGGDKFHAPDPSRPLETKQDAVNYSSIELAAARQNMASCVTFAQTTFNSRYSVFHDTNTTYNEIRFNVKDPNRTGEGGGTTALSGRYQAEMYPSFNQTSLKTIDNVDFARFVPFMTNCTSLTTAVVNDPKPIVWYATDSKLPVARLTSKTATTPTVDFPFCVRYDYSAYKDTLNRVYDKVSLISSTTPGSFNLAQFTASGQPCFSETSVIFTATEHYFLLATPCNGVSYNSGGVTVAEIVNFDPTLAANGALPAGTTLNMKMFPKFYGAVYAAGLQNSNTLRVDAVGVDSFYYSAAEGINKSVDVVATHIDTNGATAAVGYAPAPLSGMSSSTMIGYVDWDNQPSTVTITMTPTPTPTQATQVFYRINATGDLQIFSKGTAATSVTFQTADKVDGNNNPIVTVGTDPFDILQYFDLKVRTGATPTNVPAFVAPTGRTSCMDSPGSVNASTYQTNVQNSSYTYSALNDYKRCTVNWTPNAADVGKKYSYQFSVEDNYAATANVNNAVTAFGAGATYPQAVNATGNTFSIQNNSWARTHGPYMFFNISLESVEQNIAPYFGTTGTFTNNNNRYCTAISATTGCTGNTRAAGWVSIFGGSGLQPSCTATTGFTCPATPGPGDAIQEGDVLSSSTAWMMLEGRSDSIKVYVKDDNIRAELKNINATAPRKVLVIDKTANKTKSYTVPSLANATLRTDTDPNGATIFILDWQPTDAEAFQLSNKDGFLIPFVVADQDYNVFTDGDQALRDAFNVKKITRTIWVWATMQVRNNPPTLSYIDPANPTVENPLSGAKLTFETGVAKTYTIRVRDSDRARYDIGSETLTFTANAVTKPSFITDPAPSPNPAVLKSSTAGLYQDYTITNNRVLTPTDISVNNYTFNAVDPGDPTKCWVEGNTASCKTRAGDAGAVTATQSFTVEVVGKPFLLAPHTDTDPTQTRNFAPVYVNSTSNPVPFNFPLSMSISKQSEKGVAFFFGIPSTAGASIPMKTTLMPASTPVPASAKGIYINELGVVKWPDATYDRVGTSLDIPIYGVAQSNCGSGTNITLYRYNEALNAIQTCGLSTTSATANAASDTLKVTVYNNYEVPALPNLQSVNVTRTQDSAQASSAAARAEASAQYSSFKGRCQYCGGASPTSTGGGAAPTNLALNPSTDTGSAQFLTSGTGYQNDFSYNYAAGNLRVIQSFSDNTPTATGAQITVPALKGETVTFSGTIGTVSNIRQYYRWYVNGCLKKSGPITQTTFSYDLPVTLLMSGLNNDCSGEYSLTENLSGRLGTLKVRLNVVNNIETVTSTTDNAVKTYLWTVNVLNNKPSLQNGSAVPSVDGNMSITMAMPVSYAAKSYLALIDPHSTSGAAIRMHEILSTGLVQGTSIATRSSIITQPTQFGVTSAMMIALSNSTSYPATSTDTSNVFKSSSRAFGSNWTGSAMSIWNLSQSSIDVASYSVFANQWLSSMPSAVFRTTTTPFDSTQAANYYLIDGEDGFGYRAVRQYWAGGSNNINSGASIYGGNTSPLTGSLGVRKNVVYNSTLFQFIGPKNESSPNPTGSKINILSLSTNGNYLSSSVIKTINFSSVASAPNCVFDGAPIDGVYAPAVDTLFVLALKSGTTGQYLAIRNATTTSATCVPLTLEDVNAKEVNPSLDLSRFNPNLSKSVLDATTGMIYGVSVPKDVSGTPQLYIIDTFTSKIYVQPLASTINPSSLIFSKEQNAVLIMDGDRVTGKVPTLYKVW